MRNRFTTLFLSSLLLLGCGMGHAADKDLKRLVEIGPTPQATCEALTKKSLLGYENAPEKVKLGTCTCGPSSAKGSSGAVECVLYFTT